MELTPEQLKRQRTVSSLKKRLREKSDLPVLSNTIGIVQKQAAAIKQTSVNSLSSDILDDFALTNKLLKLVNTAYYTPAHKSGKISTITRAIFVLGFDVVKNAAISLMMMEDLNNNAMSQESKDIAIMSLMCGNIAKELAATANIRKSEEAFICAMFHDIGKLLVSFYMPEESGRINELVKSGTQPATASLNELGISFEELGIIIGKEWHFSDQVLNAMRKIPHGGKAVAPNSQEEQLRNVANFSSELCAVINASGASPDPAVLEELLKRYESCLPNLTIEALSDILKGAIEELSTYSDEFKAKLQESPFINKVTTILEGVMMDNALEYETIAPASEDLMSLGAMDLKPAPVDAMDESRDVRKEMIRAEDILTRGIQNITSSMLADKSFDDLLKMILDIMYRALGFTRVIFAIKDRNEPLFIGRYGFGEDIDKFLNGFRFKLEGTSRDVFNITISQGSDIVIANVNEPRIASTIPGWYRNISRAGTFLIFSVTIERKTIGLIYADKIKSGDIDLPPEIMRHLSTLRDQAVLAIKHSRR